MSRRKPVLLLACCLIVVLVAALSAGCGAKKEEKTSKKPKVLIVAPDSGQAGAQFEIAGERFGNTQGDGVVHVGSLVAGVKSWSDTRIDAVVPNGLTPAAYPVNVLTASGESNYVEFSVTGGGSQQPDRKEGQVEHVTAEQAMIAFEKKAGKDISGMSFSIVQVSEKDPNWKIDVAQKAGQPSVYFLLHKVNGDWVIVDDGTALSKTELAAKGAPSDLYTPPQPTSQYQAVVNYMKNNGIDPTGVSVTVTRVSSIDPAWELGLASKAGQPQQTVVFHKESGNWVVKLMGSNVTSDQMSSIGVPSDLVHTSTEAQAIANWISSGNAPPGVVSTGWSFKVIEVSKSDPNWEIVQGTQQQSGTMYFVLHWENGQWVVKDAGGTLTKQDLNAPGMPADIP